MIFTSAAFLPNIGTTNSFSFREPVFVHSFCPEEKGGVETIIQKLREAACEQFIHFIRALECDMVFVKSNANKVIHVTTST